MGRGKKKEVAPIAPVEEPTKETSPEDETFAVNLFDHTDIVINGEHVKLPAGAQRVSKHIYNVLRDANLA